MQREAAAGVGSSQLGSQAPVIASKVQRDRIGDGLEARRPEAVSRAHMLLSFGTLSAEHLSPICTADMGTSLNDAVRIRRDHSFNTPDAKQPLKTVLFCTPLLPDLPKVDPFSGISSSQLRPNRSVFGNAFQPHAALIVVGRLAAWTSPGNGLEMQTLGPHSSLSE